MVNPVNSLALLQPFGKYLQNEHVNEILVNKPNEYWVELKGKLTRICDNNLDLNYFQHLFQVIAKENHQVINRFNPILSGNLSDGSRVQLCLPPVAKHPVMSIRRQVVQEMRLSAYSQSGFYEQVKNSDVKDLLSEEDEYLLELYQFNRWNEFIKQAVLAKKNIIISGGTSTGKTTYLNACLHAIPSVARIITLEDTYEITIPHLNQVNLLAIKGQETTSVVTMQDLVQCCLRLRPDRIIMGEIRGKEILDFIAACSTGHEGSITSIHANNPRQAFSRMVQLYKLNNVPAMTNEQILQEIKNVVDVIVQLEKSPQGRRVQSIYYKYAGVDN